MGHLWNNSGTKFAGSISASTLRDYPSARTIRKLGGLICSGACLSQSCTDGDPGTQRRSRLALLLKAAPPELPVSAAAARSVLRIPAGSLLPIHLLHADAQDKYHGCIMNDMMLMMNESQ